MDDQFLDGNRVENVTFTDSFNGDDQLEKNLEIFKGFSATWDSFGRKSSSFRNISVNEPACGEDQQPTLLITQNDVLNPSSGGLNCDLKDWGLSDEIVSKYEGKGVREMFPWQVECLSNPRLLENCGNLIYSAPTSAGKTLVAEILAIKTVIERKKKVIVILPFISVVREKMFHLQDILSESGIRVEGFMGSHAPPGGIDSVHIAVCTIEKANSLINHMMEDGKIRQLGAVVVDELHLLGDPHRGYILELLLTKLNYLIKKDGMKIQIVGMSATLPNLNTVSDWLCADLYKTEFRPIPLTETCLISNVIYDANFASIRTINKPECLTNDKDHIVQLCLETIFESRSVLIFCPTKNWCENLAQQIASTFKQLGYSDTEYGAELRKQLSGDLIGEVLTQLKASPVGLDSVLGGTVSFGVAFHHAGLTMDERDIIEGAFKSGTLRVLIATSTLSSGVNLPAKRVIIRSPMFNSKPINALTYKQMVGRAGRMGIDSSGECVLICNPNERNAAANLLIGDFDPITSCLNGDDKLMRAVLEAIASEITSTTTDVKLFIKSTLLLNSAADDVLNERSERIVSQLESFELIQKKDEDYVATALGKACLASSMSPQDGLALFVELQKARESFVLETDLHMIYLVTPYSICSQWGELNWLNYLNLWESLSPAMKRVGKLIGINEGVIYRNVRNFEKSSMNKYQIYKRFYTALALQDLIGEIPLNVVADKFDCSRGMLQSLQQSAATFAGMVTSFSRQLGWKNFEILVSQFQDRLYFGIQHELLDLMKLQSMNSLRARSIFNAGIKSIFDLANAKIATVETALKSSVPFQSEKIREGEHEYDANRRIDLNCIWITGKKGVTVKTAAELLIGEARKYLELEMGVNEVKWSSSEESIVITHSTPNHQIESKVNSIMESTDSGNITRESLDISVQINDSKRSSNIFEDSLIVDSQLCKILDTKIRRSDVSNKINDSQSLFDDSFEAIVKNKRLSKDIVLRLSDFASDFTDNDFMELSVTIKRKLSDLMQLDADDTNPNKRFKSNDSIKPIVVDLSGIHADANIRTINVYSCTDREILSYFHNWASNQEKLSIHVDIVRTDNTKIKIGNNILNRESQNDRIGLSGISIYSNGCSFYFDLHPDGQFKLNRDDVIGILNVFTDKRKKIVLYDGKRTFLSVFRSFGIRIEATWEDPLIADWLIDPEGSIKSLYEMAEVYCSYKIMNVVQSMDQNKAAISSINAWTVNEVIGSILEQFTRKHAAMIKTFEFEMKALKVTAICELSGISVDKVKAGTTLNLIKSTQKILEINAFKMAGRRFRFTSSSDVARVIGIYKGRRMKTNRQVLERIDNPLAETVIYWRKLNAILTKNLFPLILKAANESHDERIYGSYWTHTSTGRITMQEPNLQSMSRNFDIPPELLSNNSECIVNRKNEFRCRNIFVSRQDCVFISADYCQLELRLLTHMSKDPTLIKIVKSDEDIFKSIAAAWKCIPEDDVNDDLRQKAKNMCYGIIYGMGARTLAHNLDMNELDAEIFMKTFHDAYPNIKRYINSTVAECKRSGYVETLNGRRRYLPLINSKNMAEKGHAERQAVNTTIQGTAADILKSAMISINDTISTGRSIKLVLLLHDELMYEIPADELRTFGTILKRCMENTVKLSVPLPVKIKYGKSWGDMNELII